MRAVVQRVRGAEVSAPDAAPAQIGPGLVALVAVRRGDTDQQARALAERCCRLRVFDDDAGRMNRSLLDTRGEVLVIPQFTLYADTARGRRPSFDAAEVPDAARQRCAAFAAACRTLGVPTREGFFGARMLVRLENDGPVTLILEDS